MLGLLLVDHGSRVAVANAQLGELAALVRRLRPDDLVGIAHLELAEPAIAQGVDTLVAQGAREIRVLCCFLADGRHSRDDVPRLAQAAAARHPGVVMRIGGAIGVHEALARVLLERAGL